MFCQLISARGGARNDGQSDQVGIKGFRNFLDALIDEYDLSVELRRDKGGKSSERQRLVTQRLTENSPTMAVQRPFRGNQSQSQGSSITMEHAMPPPTAHRSARGQTALNPWRRYYSYPPLCQVMLPQTPQTVENKIER